MGFRCLAGMSRVRGGLLVVVMTALLGACGGGDDPAAASDDGAAAAGTAAGDGTERAVNPGVGVNGILYRGGMEYFPLGSGDQWVYRTANDSLVKFKVAGRESVGGVDATVVSHNVPGFAAYEQVRFVVDEQGVRQVPGPDAGTVLQALGPLQVMRFPLTPRERFVQVDRTLDSGVDVDGDGRTDALTIRAEVTMVGFEHTRVEAGLFLRAAHLRTRIEQSLVGSGNGVRSTLTATLDDWYAPGVGLVRSRGLYREGDSVQDVSQALVAYRVSGRRSDLVPPLVVRTDPAPGSLQGSRTVVHVDFSEPLDADAITPDSFTVANSTGAIVPGYVSMEGNRLNFRSYAPWPSGVYTVRLRSGLVDFSGNAVRPRSWSFTVEAEAPTPVSLSPDRDAQDAPLDSVLRAQFSESLDSSTVPGSVRLINLDSGAEVAATVSLANPTTLEVRPQVRLLRATRYLVQFSSTLTDLRGNPVLVSQPWTFATDPGMFAFPTLVSPQWAPEAVAIGDVNGDGLQDVVMSTYFSFDPENDFKLVVYLQRADGTLAEPLRLPTASHYDCKASSLAVADLDGDGRNDVAVGESGCGVEIFLQRADGTLASGNWLPSLDSHRVRAADVNGDGLADLVGVGADSREVSVWTQVGGRMSLPAVTGVDVVGGGDLAVGDLNGDGRADIAVTSQGGDPARSVAVLYQQPDGRFGTPVYAGVDASWTARGVAIGDLDGDGRADLAVTWGGAAPAALSIYHQRSDGTLAAPVTRGSLDYPGAITLADVNLDARLDVVVAHDGWGSVGVYLQSADGTLREEERYASTDGSANLHGLAVGDLNGDGRPDIAQAGLSVLYNRGAQATTSNARSVVEAAAQTRLRWWQAVGGRAAADPASGARIR